jgi:hypothetical protein
MVDGGGDCASTSHAGLPKPLRASVRRRTFGPHRPIQRCQIHKARNVPALISMARFFLDAGATNLD